MNVTIVDIAERTGVSYTSVSRALTGKKGVSDKTRKLILEEAAKLGYQPNAIARGLVRKSTDTIGLVIPDITNPFFPEVARGVEDACREKGFNLFLCNTNWDGRQERLSLEALQKNRVAGVIINPSSAENVPYLEAMGSPVVFLNSIIDEGKMTCVSVDNIHGARMAVRHLKECGYARIAYIGGTLQSYSNRQRLKGYREALEAEAFPVDESLIANGEFSTDFGHKTALRLFSLEKRPDAVFAGNDILALGALQGLQELGLSVPTEVGLIGFDDIFASGLPQVQLTTVSTPKTLLGRKAFEMLFEKIGNSDPVAVQYVIQPRLVIRGTTSQRSKFP